MPPGLFVTIEGPEGGGKTTQLGPLAAALAADGRPVTVAREPGGTPVGEAIRALLLQPGGDMLPITEALLFCAARAELVARVIRPALDAGHIVLCDRYADSTLAYQGYGRGLPLQLLHDLVRASTGGLVPDLTLLLDLPPSAGLGRRRAAGELNRLDDAGLAFHARVREGFLRLREAEPERFVVVPADGPPADVAHAMRRAVAERLARQPAA